MLDKLKASWQHTPAPFRKTAVFIVGMLFIVAAVLTGWLPGPGGIPLFLIGIAILATEFTWAERVRDWVLKLIKEAGIKLRNNKLAGGSIIAGGILAIIGLAYLFYHYLR